MRAYLPSTLILLSISTPLIAQDNVGFAIYPGRDGVGSTTYTSRTDTIWDKGGEMLLSAPGDLFVGIGDNGTACEVNGFWHHSQDQNPLTVATYHLVLRGHDTVTGAPDMTTSGLLSRVGPLSLPPATQGGATENWLITDTFGTAAPIPCQGGFYYGIELTPEPNLWTDGHGIWTAWYIPSAGYAGALGDNPRAGAPELTWASVAGSGIAVPGMRASAGGATHFIGILTANPNLNIGNIDPSTTTLGVAGASGYGAAGLYPDITGSPRSDGLDLRISHPGNPGGSAFAVIGVGISPFGAIPVTGAVGRFWLDPVLLITFGNATLDVDGVGTIPIAVAGALNPSLIGQPFFFQSVTIGASVGLTNVQGVNF